MRQRRVSIPQLSRFPCFPKVSFSSLPLLNCSRVRSSPLIWCPILEQKASARLQAVREQAVSPCQILLFCEIVSSKEHALQDRPQAMAAITKALELGTPLFLGNASRYSRRPQDLQDPKTFLVTMEHEGPLSSVQEQDGLRYVTPSRLVEHIAAYAACSTGHSMYTSTYYYLTKVFKRCSSTERVDTFLEPCVALFASALLNGKQAPKTVHLLTRTSGPDNGASIAYQLALTSMVGETMARTLPGVTIDQAIFDKTPASGEFDDLSIVDIIN